MSSHYYEAYKEHCAQLEEMMRQHGASSADAKKLRGAVAVELLKREITNYLDASDKPFKLSPVNAYILGSKYEYDLLIIKESADPYLGFIYNPGDVVAIIESKAGGLFDVDKGTSSIRNAVNTAVKINPDIKFGYITISENVPVNEYKKDGTETVKHWELTKKHLEEKIGARQATYAVTLHKGKNLCDEGSDKEFHDFIDYLIK